MTPLLIIIGLAALAGLLRPIPRTHVVYVPIEVVEDRAGGIGCAPLLLLALVALGVLALLGGG